MKVRANARNRYSLCSEKNCIVVEPTDSLPLEAMAPLGCSVETGAGAVLCSLKCEPGSSIVVFGTGGVGMCAIMAARAAGCTTIVAVDINDARLALALELGATHAVNSMTGNAAEELRAVDASGPKLGGFDYSLDTTGRPDVLRTAIEALRPTGVCGLIGGSPPGSELKVDMLTLLLGRTVRGIIQGDAQSKALIPRLLRLHAQGLFPFDRLITYYDGLDQINAAVADSKVGKAIKPVIRL